MYWCYKSGGSHLLRGFNAFTISFFKLSFIGVTSLVDHIYFGVSMLSLVSFKRHGFVTTAATTSIREIIPFMLHQLDLQYITDKTKTLPNLEIQTIIQIMNTQRIIHITQSDIEVPLLFLEKRYPSCYH